MTLSVKSMIEENARVNELVRGEVSMSLMGWDVSVAEKRILEVMQDKWRKAKTLHKHMSAPQREDDKNVSVFVRSMC